MPTKTKSRQRKLRRADLNKVSPITNSLRKRWQYCKKAFGYMVEEGWRSRKSNAPMLRGSAVHLYIQKIFEGKKHATALKHALKYIDDHIKENEAFYTPDEREKIDLARSLVIGICRGFQHQFQGETFKVVAFEETLKYPIRDLTGDFSVYAGTLDCVLETKEGYWVRDYKTKGFVHHMLSEWLNLDTQMLGYNWLLRNAIKEGWFRPGGKKANKPVIGVIYNIAKITRVRHKQTQTLEEFHDELQEVYVERHDEYFESIPVKQSVKAIADFEEELYQEVREIHETATRKKNTNMCIRPGFTCEYLPLCIEGWTRVNKQLYVRDETPYWDPKVSLEQELDI